MIKNKIIVFALISVFLSCKEEKSPREKLIDYKWKQARYYSSKYIPAIKEFRKYIYTTYFQNLDVAQLKKTGKCDTINPICYPFPYHLNLDSIIRKHISFSEKIGYASIMYRKDKHTKYIIWCSDMDNYCTAEGNFIKTNIPNEELAEGDCLIEQGVSVDVFSSKESNGSVILLGTDSFLNDNPLLIKIYLKKE